MDMLNWSVLPSVGTWLQIRNEAVTIPTEDELECVCELIQPVGVMFACTRTGGDFLERLTARLRDLVNDSSHALSKRVQCRIWDILDVRAHGFDAQPVDGDMLQWKMRPSVGTWLQIRNAAA